MLERHTLFSSVNIIQSMPNIHWLQIAFHYIHFFSFLALIDPKLKASLLCILFISPNEQCICAWFESTLSDLIGIWWEYHIWFSLKLLYSNGITMLIYSMAVPDWAFEIMSIINEIPHIFIGTVTVDTEMVRPLSLDMDRHLYISYLICCHARQKSKFITAVNHKFDKTKDGLFLPTSLCVFVCMSV